MCARACVAVSEQRGVDGREGNRYHADQLVYIATSRGTAYFAKFALVSLQLTPRKQRAHRERFRGVRCGGNEQRKPVPPTQRGANTGRGERPRCEDGDDEPIL